MPRVARKKSNTGIYHIILRGINRQIIFEDDEDYRKFIYTLSDFKEKSGYVIFAYCLMSNHIHLLIKEGHEDFGIAFRRIGSRYVYWYNMKYGRSGHLFQDRYKSETVECDRYFLKVLQYIHLNPVKAGIVESADKYCWSSFSEYLYGHIEGYKNIKNLCDVEYIDNVCRCNNITFSNRNEKTGAISFDDVDRDNEKDKILEYDEKIRLNDNQAVIMIKEKFGLKIPGDVQKFSYEKRNEFIKEFKKSGMSYRQIERLTGLSYGIIRRI